MAYAIDADAHLIPAQRSGLVGRLAQRVTDYLAYRSVRDQLEALSARDLADIGLSRHDLRDVARAAVYGA